MASVKSVPVSPSSSDKVPPPIKLPIDEELNGKWNVTPSYLDMAQGSLEFFIKSYEYLTKEYDFPSQTKRDLHRVWNNITQNDIIIVCVLTLVWTLGRYLCTKYIFKPVGQSFRLARSDQAKMPESAWKFLFYLGSWSAIAYSVFKTTGPNYFSHPYKVWQDYSMDYKVETDIHNIYLVQLSFYIHSLYTTLFVDQWRKDSLVLMAHHIVTVFLLSFSLGTRSHRSGILALLFHDVCDILLEGTKLCLYFKSGGGPLANVLETIANVGFGCFTVTWFMTRLYWFPLKVIYGACNFVQENKIQVPFILFLDSMLWILLAMNIYWFTFILKLLYKVVTGQVEELEDNRDYKEEEDEDVDPNGNIRSRVVGQKEKGKYYLRHRKESSVLAGDAAGRSQ